MRLPACMPILLIAVSACAEIGPDTEELASEVDSASFDAVSVTDVPVATCGGILGRTCADDAFCKFPTGTCEWRDHTGVCTRYPTACPDNWDPVCGCDGVTYSNRCDADAAGVSLAHEGRCRDIISDVRHCGGFPGTSCRDGEYCHYGPEACEVGDAVGVCRPLVLCSDLWNPVCSCDGRTFRNECLANHAGAIVAHPGVCPLVEE